MLPADREWPGEGVEVLVTVGFLGGQPLSSWFSGPFAPKLRRYVSAATQLVVQQRQRDQRQSEPVHFSHGLQDNYVRPRQAKS